eukprot:88416_1
MDKTKESDMKEEGFDEVFLNRCEIIKEKKKTITKSKAVFAVNDSNKDKYLIHQYEPRKGTEMQGLLTYFQTHLETTSQQFADFVAYEEYDTDAIQDDIGMGIYGIPEQSNIGNCFLDKQTWDGVTNYVYLSKLFEYTFHTGYRMYYWKYYTKKQESNIMVWDDNINNHQNHNVYELCVPQKYTNLKDELLNNNIMTLTEFQFKRCINKANKYIYTEKATTLTATPDYGVQLFEHDRNDDLHYGIKAGTPITSHHLLSVIVYTDWPDITSKFTATFRKSNVYDTISQIKQKNAEYANWSRLLRETVELFGFSYSGQYNNNYTNQDNKIINRLKGPFFCRMSFTMVLPSFDIRLCSPISTSKKEEVADVFAGDHGILIQLNISIVNKFSDNISAFGCSWLSNYSGEFEYIFCGGGHRIRIETIKLISTNTNFTAFISPLFRFECILNGTDATEDHGEIVDKDLDCKQIVENLIFANLNAVQNKYPKYVNNTFRAFVHHKTQIIINLSIISKKKNHRLSELIINSMVKQSYNTKLEQTTKTPKPYKLAGINDSESWSKAFVDSSWSLFRSYFFQLFTNVRDIMIYSTSIWGNEEYFFNILQVVASIYSQTKNNIKIRIKAVDRYDFEMWKNKQFTISWLRCHLETRENLTELKKNYNVEMTRGTNGIGRGEDCVTITKK